MSHAHHAQTTAQWLAHNWLWIVIVAWAFGGMALEVVREFLVSVWEMITYPVTRAVHNRRKHQLKLEKIRLEQAKFLAQQVPKKYLVAGPCAHPTIAPVMTSDPLEPELVGWVCRNPNCQKQLPPDWAVRQENPE